MEEDNFSRFVVKVKQNNNGCETLVGFGFLGYNPKIYTFKNFTWDQDNICCKPSKFNIIVAIIMDK